MTFCRAAGSHSLPLKAQSLPAGVYYYTLETDGTKQIKKCILLIREPYLLLLPGELFMGFLECLYDGDILGAFLFTFAAGNTLGSIVLWSYENIV